MVEKIFVNANVSMQRSEYFVNKLPKNQTPEQASMIRMMATDLQEIEILTEKKLFLLLEIWYCPIPLAH